MEKYQRLIEQLASKKDSFIYNNSGKEHAQIVLGTLFKYAEKEIRMATGNLSDAVLDNPNVINNLQSFLAKGGTIKVILDDYNKNGDSKLLRLLQVYQLISESEGVIVKKFNKEKKFTSDSGQIHFTTVDNSMYRLETDTTNFKASGSFNNTAVTQNLNKKFEEVFSNENLTQPI